MKSNQENRNSRRTYGIHFTSTEIFHKHIFPEIKGKLYDFIWVDLYAGEGNLILPILDFIPHENRIKFFKNHIYLFDIQSENVNKCIKNAGIYDIPPNISKNNIINRNNLEGFPKFLNDLQFPIYHITNPPYLYLGYIRKHQETQNYLKYFEAQNEGYQDLYQIAMINDLRNNIENLIYIIPSNFLFGSSVSNKFRLDFLKYYDIRKMIIFETKIFEFTGTNICIGFFKRKLKPKTEILEFEGLKIKNGYNHLNKKYILKPNFKFRAGSEFSEFLEKYKSNNPLIVKYYLSNKEVLKNKGNNKISVIDSNSYLKHKYRNINLYVNDYLRDKIEYNILYVQTVDKGSTEGRVGLEIISHDFNVKGIYVSGSTYRTHPIQIFFEPQLTIEDQILLKNYFNFILESYREKLDSEFLTTYKYSNATYTRKYLGLIQVRELIETFPISKINTNKEIKDKFRSIVVKKEFIRLLNMLKKLRETHNY